MINDFESLDTVQVSHFETKEADPEDDDCFIYICMQRGKAGDLQIAASQQPVMCIPLLLIAVLALAIIITSLQPGFSKNQGLQIF